jgi:hypothetical protein
MHEQVRHRSHRAVLLSLQNPDLAARKHLVKHLGNKVTARRTFTAKQKQSRNFQGTKPLRREDVAVDAAQFMMNGMRRGDSRWPVRSSLQGSNLMERHFDNITEKKQQGFFSLSCIQ